MRLLQPGQPAPDFATSALVADKFKPVKLSDFKGKYVLLLFYPADLYALPVPGPGAQAPGLSYTHQSSFISHQSSLFSTFLPLFPSLPFPIHIHAHWV